MHKGDPDINWLAAFHKGDWQAFKEVYLANYRALYLFTAGILKNDPEQAEDIVQEAFRKLWENRQKVRDAGHIRNFLFLVTRNACYNALRHHTVRLAAYKAIPHLSPSEERNAEAQRIHAEVIAEIYRQIDALPEHYATVIKMLYINEMKAAEVAAELGISVNAVLIQKTRALKMLRINFLNRSLLAWLIFSWYFQ